MVKKWKIISEWKMENVKSKFKDEYEEVQVQVVVARGEEQSIKRRRYVLSYPCCLQSKTLSLHCGPLVS